MLLVAKRWAKFDSWKPLLVAKWSCCYHYWPCFLFLTVEKIEQKQCTWNIDSKYIATHARQCIYKTTKNKMYM